MQLEAVSLVKKYGVHLALDQAEFMVPTEARCVVLLGASGSGKSTLLRILGSLLSPDAGEVKLDGKPLGWHDEETLLQRRKNGFVFQSFNLFPHQTVLENVALPLRVVHDWGESAARQRSLDVLERFGLGLHVDKHPGELSGGQQQRVALARAIAHEPQLLLLDEPTSALDPIMTQEVLDLIRTLAEGKQQIVLSTHEISFARKVADWVVFLDKGKVIESVPSGQFFENPTSDLAKLFLEALTRYR
ncbi:amino acid ABC transporter ATP-binding protein [soil metagenome]